MHGTIEDPPIVVQQDPNKWAVFWIIYAGVACLSLVQARNGHDISSNYATAAISGAILLPLTLRIVRPGSLVIDRSGITFRTLLRTRHFHWNQCAGFKVIHMRLGTDFMDQVAIIGPDRRKLSVVPRRRVDLLGAFWEIRRSELVDLLNGARERWGG